MSDEAYWLPASDVLERETELLEGLVAQLGEASETALGSDLTAGRLSGLRFDWRCGSWAERSVGFLEGQEGGEVSRFVFSVRGGPVQGEAYERSGWFKPVEVARFRGEVELALKACGVAPWDEQAAAVAAPTEPPAGALQGGVGRGLEGLADSVRGPEVLGDLDGERKRIRRAKEYYPCVACGEALVVGQLYERQAGSSSPRRRVHVECLRERGLAL